MLADERAYRSLTLPYLPFVDALRSYVLTQDPAQLRRELGVAAADVARIVPDLRDKLRLRPRAPGDPDEDRWRLYQAIIAFVRSAAASRPLLVVLEDLHWAEWGTLDLLVHVARNLEDARALLVGTYRDVDVDRTHPLVGALAELGRVARIRRLKLTGLSSDDVQRMLTSLQGQEVPPSVADAVYQQTEGNPLFVQEVYRTVPRSERTEVLGQIVRHMSDQLTVVGLYYNAVPGAISSRLLNVGTRWPGPSITWNAHEWDVRL